MSSSSDVTGVKSDSGSTNQPVTSPDDTFLEREESIDPSYEPKILKQCGKSIECDEFDPERERKILVLYSGGTIGMRVNSEGVYVPEPNFLVPQLKKQRLFHDNEYAELYSKNEPEQPLVLPLSKDGMRIVYVIYEYEPLLDSSNMTYDDYALLAKDIKRNYHQFDGFVILHGTDTMAYTASALSFMLENLGKPVILTGSQIPIFEQRSDGRDNFLSALIMAGHYSIPEVSILFDNKLFRGNRSTKVDAGDFDAFQSPNMAPLAILAVEVKVSWDAIFRHKGLFKFDVHTHMSPFVGVLRLFPSITEATVRAFLQPPMLGVVLQTYGAGNGPAARADIMAALKEANDRGVIIINISQCPRGSVSPLYEAGQGLVDAGVIAGCDMTVEAALTKLSYVLGKDTWSPKHKRKMVGTNLRGEMTVARTKEESSLLEYSLIEKMVETMQLSSNEEIKILRDSVFPPLMCHAARDGKVDTLEKLREAGASFGLSDYDGRTPLHIATCEGHVEVVKYLLFHGAPVHVRDRYGHSPLDDAVRFHRFDIIGVLQEAGAHMRIAPFKLGMFLCNCAVTEDPEGMLAWFTVGSDLNQGDYDGRTPLHQAAVYNRENMCKFLLDHGARPDVKDHFGNSPLDEARKSNSQEIVILLMKHLSCEKTVNGKP